MDLALPAFDQVPVPFEHGRNLFTLVRVDQETDFKMSHCYSFRICGMNDMPSKPDPSASNVPEEPASAVSQVRARNALPIAKPADCSSASVMSKAERFAQEY